jgi:hypothetical protein
MGLGSGLLLRAAGVSGITPIATGFQTPYAGADQVGDGALRAGEGGWWSCLFTSKWLPGEAGGPDSADQSDAWAESADASTTYMT